MKFTAPTGVFDIVPENDQELWRTSPLWNHLEEIISHQSLLFGFRELRTPIFERAELFSRSSGETSDIVSKEMYLFDDKGGRPMALRPEGTAPAMRAFIENNFASSGQYHKLFYIGAMFRYDRPQAGRYRQHHQWGVEAIGYKSPEQDVEVIDLLYSTLKRLGLTNLEIRLNSIGDTTARATFKEALKEFLKPQLSHLSEDSQKRFETNPLRILDSKDEADQKILAAAPSILDYLSEESYFHFERVKTLLTKMSIPFTVDSLLVRGLDYYNDTVFEVVTKDLGAQNSLGGGGRYDSLLASLDGPDLPAVGFGAGLERILQTMIKQNVPQPEKKRPSLMIIPMGEAALSRAVIIAHQLRELDVSTLIDFSGRKVGKAMQYASDIGARFVIVLGENELQSQTVELKDMDSGKTNPMHIEALGTTMQLIQKSVPFINLWTGMDQPTAEDQNILIERMRQSFDETTIMTNKFHDQLEQMRKLLEEENNE